MQTMFLNVKSIARKLKQSKNRFQVVKTDLNESVPEQSLSLWQQRGLKPFSQGTAHIKFEGKDKVYVYPLFFENNEMINSGKKASKKA